MGLNLGGLGKFETAIAGKGGKAAEGGGVIMVPNGKTLVPRRVVRNGRS